MSALSLPEDRALAIVANTIRILGQNKLYVGSRKSRTSTSIPVQVATYLSKVSSEFSVNSDALMGSIAQLLFDSQIINENWILRIDLLSSAQLALQIQTQPPFRCQGCSRVTAFELPATCISPDCDSIAKLTLSGDDQDYYQWVSKEQAHRLRVAELTGQTKPLSQQRSDRDSSSRFFLTARVTCSTKLMR